MHSLRAIVYTSVLVGLVAGAAVSALQLFATTPLILKAEAYETAAETAPAPAAHSHADNAAPHSHEDAGHHGGWQPEDGLERNGLTVAANILTAIGYALVLTGLISLHGRPVTWREGALWGLAGFACVMLAPTLGLPPELPGTPAGPLEERQLWWIGTACATAAGLGLIAFKRAPWSIALAAVLIAAPHLIGAPSAPQGEYALAPEALERQFVIAATLTSLAFWALLGSLSGALLRRFEV
jgi:cobalt transporter subunit CbtA